MRVAGLDRKRSFLFDLDGTLLDSNEAHARAFREALSDGHPELARAFDYEAVRGLDTPASLRRIGVSDPEAIARLADRKRAIYRELLRGGQVQLHAGAAELIAALHAAGATLVLVTSASRRTAEEAIAATGIAHRFRGVVTSEDAGAPKSTPEPFLAALTRFTLDAATCLTVDDAPAAALGSLRAGVDAALVHGTEAPSGVPCFASLHALGAALGAWEAGAP